MEAAWSAEDLVRGGATRVIFDECLLGKTSFTQVRKLSLLSFLKSTISSKTTKTTFPSSDGKNRNDTESDRKSVV